jgi:hypothetical protein
LAKRAPGSRRSEAASQAASKGAPKLGAARATPCSISPSSRGSGVVGGAARALTATSAPTRGEGSRSGLAGRHRIYLVDWAMQDVAVS